MKDVNHLDCATCPNRPRSVSRGRGRGRPGLLWRGMDSNFHYASAVNLVVAPFSRPAAWDLSARPFADRQSRTALAAQLAGGNWIRTFRSGRARPESVVGSGELRAFRDTRARQPDRKFTARAEWRSGCIRAAEGRLHPQQLRSKATLGGRQPKGLRVNNAPRGAGHFTAG